MSVSWRVWVDQLRGYREAGVPSVRLSEQTRAYETPLLGFPIDHRLLRQALFWDFSNTLSERQDQQYFASDLRPKSEGQVRLRVAHLPPDAYHLSVFRVGYRINDPYTQYIDMGKPSQLTRAQAGKLKSLSDGEPVFAETVVVGRRGELVRDYPMRENDVYLVTVSK